MDYPDNLSETDRHWLDLIQECRTSGKSDHQWLEENNIAAPTFYYYVRQLRKKACEIPTRSTSCEVEIQEVVPLIIEDEKELAPLHLDTDTTKEETVAVRINIRGISVEISSSATQDVIQNTISALRLLC